MLFRSLYAAGEVACTGVHGANRLASNSLLECLVFAKRAAEWMEQNLDLRPIPPELPGWDDSKVTDSDEEVVVAHNWDEIRRFMWDYVGIVRTDKRLARALNRVQLLQKEISGWDSMAQASREIYPSLSNTDHLAQCVTDLMAQGRTGMKAGAGFKTWSAEDVAQERRHYDARLKAAFQILSMK